MNGSEAYARARKIGLKEYHSRAQRGQSPYLPVLEELHITNRGYVLLKEGKAPELVPLIVK